MEMTEPNEGLKSEHEAIGELLVVLEGLAERMPGGAILPRGDLERAMAVVVELADRCHHAKEEEVLFPALAKASPEEGAELARRLTSDHRAFRKLVQPIRRLIPLAETNGGSRTQLTKNLISYTRLLREHIRIEEEMLFPEVERTLGATERARIAEEFERIEEEEIGTGMHDKYHDIIRALAQVYGRAGLERVST